MRPYADTMSDLISGVGRAASSVRSLPLLQQRETIETVLIVPLTGDRGLAGAFNGQVIRRAFALERALVAEGKKVRWVAVGKKGRSTLTFRGRDASDAYVGFSDGPVVRATPRRSRTGSPSSTPSRRSIASSSSTTRSSRR